MSDLVADYIYRVEKALVLAHLGITKLTQKQLTVQGFSSDRIRIALNELMTTDTRYLEIGVLHGSTFIPALYRNSPASAVAVDNFCQFNGNIDTFKKNCADSSISDFTLVDADCFNLRAEQKSLIKDINLYFYDGEHRHEDQHQAIAYYYDLLADVFIIIVDDWDHEPAKTGTRAGIAEKKLTVHREWAFEMGPEREWWNGLYIAVCQKPE